MRRLHHLTLGLVIAWRIHDAGAQQSTQLHFFPVDIKYRASVNGERFSCGRSYSFGSQNVAATPSDLRLYVHNIVLITDKIVGYPLALEPDSLWQTGDVALLDFENGTGPCSNGTPETRDVVHGSVAIPEGERITGIMFTLGVPEKVNHVDVTKAPAPLALTRMFWAWNTGHKFLRVDMGVQKPEDWIMHLGSMGCGRDLKSAACSVANRPTIRLNDFDPEHDVIDLDIGALFHSATVGDSTGGCMSRLGDKSCAPMFAALGLSADGSTGPAQSVFRVIHAADRSTGSGKMR